MTEWLERERVCGCLRRGGTVCRFYVADESLRQLICISSSLCAALRSFSIISSRCKILEAQSCYIVGFVDGVFCGMTNLSAIAKE